MTEKKKSGFEALATKTSLYPEEKLMKVKRGKHSFFIGLPKEISLQENRISLTPDAVALLVNNGHEVWVEAKAGIGSKFTDKQYSEAGAKIVYTPQEVYKADVILKIEPPTLEEIEMLHPNQGLISALQLGHLKTENLQALLKKKVTALAYEFIEDKVGGMPIIRAMSEIAGTTVLLIAAENLSSANSGKGVILGGITGVPPTKVVIIGAGTVAEYAARAAIGLGAEVQVFDNHIYKLRRIKSMLGQQIYTSTIDTLTLSETLKSADVVIGALRAEKGRARHVISEEMVMRMKTDSLIIDLSIDQGGCIETAKPTTHSNPSYEVNGVVHYCVTNMPAAVPNTSTLALTNATFPYVMKIAQLGAKQAILSDNGTAEGVNTYAGTLTYQAVAQSQSKQYRPIRDVLA